MSLFQDQVELTGLSDALVGSDETFGLSFEQKKRLSIAVELAASPSVIFLDEVRGLRHSVAVRSVCFLTRHAQPTSGLDARSALLVVKTLRGISDAGRTVVATIHQPSSAVFGMFVSERGRTKHSLVIYLTLSLSTRMTCYC